MASSSPKYDVVTVPTFDARLDEVLLYRVTFHGQRSAKRLIDALEALTTSLATLPGLGANLDAWDAKGFQLRWAAVDSYNIVIYSIHENERAVLLQDLFHRNQNWREVIES